MTKTTVVIPNYNGMAYLQDCLESLSKQAYSFDTIVVDNGSQDGSCSFIKEHFPKVALISLPENLGFCRAVNIGIKATKTPYVLLLNNDVKVEADFVKNLEHALEKKKDYFSIGAKMVSMKEPEQMDDAGDFYCALGWAFARGKGRPEKDYQKSGQVFSACAGAAIYRRQVFQEIGYFDENHFAYLEDVDIGYRAKIFGYKNGFCHKAVVLHAGSGFSGSRYNEFKVTLSSRNSMYVIGKNMPFLQIFLNAPLLLAGIFIKWIFFTRKSMGKIYIQGIMKGIYGYLTKVRKEKKVPFQMKHFKNYCRIQMELWGNLLIFLRNA
ncbi:MAG: glycosyltransferase family 2 protein [Roseburia sp.]|nr:glycosyltransferase family 2 protein [Roseburia sp.]MCM1278756.1 glycosyltransferase family 2 protein [Robinsoniella sp.]